MDRIIATYLFILTMALQVQSQSPKVGLVLSGGGAKGMAHIGVLKVLEEVGIIPDYITGTSMGAVVGGLYAMGYTPEELETIARTADWDVLLGNKIKLSNVAIEHKAFYGRYQLVLPVNKFNIGLPAGLIEGQELSELLVRLTAPVHDVSDFDSLPRPFKCIGADIVTGERVVLESGFLASAIRASMAIPTIFTPVEIDGRLLVDGGLVHNFPVEEVIEMGADIVIGVSVSDSILEASELSSLIDILTQATFIASYSGTKEQRAMVDYFIRPRMSPYTAGSFKQADSILARGEMAARDMYDRLKSLADSLKTKREFEPIKRPTGVQSFRIADVAVRGNSAIDDDLVLGKLDIQPNDTLEPQDLKSQVASVYGTLNYDRVTYELIPQGESCILMLDVKECTPGRASFNLHYDTENSVGLNATLQYRNLGLRNSRFTVDLDIAETPYANIDYFLYTGRYQHLGLSIGGRFFGDDIPIFDEDGARQAVFNSNLWEFYFNIQTASHTNRMFGLRVFTEINNVKPDVIEGAIKPFDKLNYTNFGIKPFFVRNTLDRWAFPTRGMSAIITSSINFYMNADVENPRIEPSQSLDYTLLSINGNYTEYFQLFDKLNLFTSHVVRFSNLKVDGLNVSDFYYLGGYKPNFINSGPYWGAEKYEFQLTSFYRGVLGLRYELFKNLFITGAINYLETEYPMAWFGGDFFEHANAAGLDRRFGWMAGVSFNSILGPIRLYFAEDVDRGNLIPWFSIGYNFKNQVY